MAWDTNDEWNEDIQVAFDAFLERHPQPTEQLIAMGSQTFTLEQLVEAYREGNYNVRRFINSVPPEGLIKSLESSG